MVLHDKRKEGTNRQGRCQEQMRGQEEAIDGFDIPCLQFSLSNLEEKRIKQDQKGILSASNTGHLKTLKGLPKSKI